MYDITGRPHATWPRGTLDRCATEQRQKQLTTWPFYLTFLASLALSLSLSPLSLSPLAALSFLFCAFFSFLSSSSSSSSGAGSHSRGLQFHQGQSGKQSTAEIPPPAESHKNVSRNCWLM